MLNSKPADLVKMGGASSPSANVPGSLCHVRGKVINYNFSRLLAQVGGPYYKGQARAVRASPIT